MLYGRYPLETVLALNSPLLGYAQRHRQLGDVYLRQETRSYFNLLIKLKVCSSSFLVI